MLRSSHLLGTPYRLGHCKTLVSPSSHSTSGGLGNLRGVRIRQRKQHRPMREKTSTHTIGLLCPVRQQEIRKHTPVVGAICGGSWPGSLAWSRRSCTGLSGSSAHPSLFFWTNSRHSFKPIPHTAMHSPLHPRDSMWVLVGHCIRFTSLSPNSVGRHCLGAMSLLANQSLMCTQIDTIS